MPPACVREYENFCGKVTFCYGVLLQSILALQCVCLQVRLGQSIDSSVVSLGNGRDVVVVALKQQALGHLAVLPARRFFNDLIGGNAWALGQVNRVTVRWCVFTSRSFVFFSINIGLLS